MSKYTRNNGPSPIYQWSNSSNITAGSKTGISWAEYDATSQKYLPFDTISIVNNSSVNLMFYINQDKPLYIPAGVIKDIPRQLVPALHSFLIENLDDTDAVAENEIYVTCVKEGITTDNLFSSLHQRLFRGSEL